MDGSGGRDFWTSLPGVLTGLAAVITALTGGWLAFEHWRDGPGQTVAIGRPASDGATTGLPAAAVTAGDPLPPGANLIAASNGGGVSISGSDNWDKMIDGDEDDAAQIGEHAGDFGVFTFRDGRAARIEAFTITVPEASPGNPTAIELSYATASDQGPFTAIGLFPVKNGRVAPDGRQTFRFAPVVAKFLKVTPRKTQGGSPYVMAYEFGALGALQ